jgi:hypothetical protein
MYHCHILEHEDRDMMRPRRDDGAGAHAVHGLTFGTPAGN